MDPFAGFIGQLVLLEGEICEVVDRRTVYRDIIYVVRYELGKDRCIPRWPC